MEITVGQVLVTILVIVGIALLVGIVTGFIPEVWEGTIKPAITGLFSNNITNIGG